MPNETPTPGNIPTVSAMFTPPMKVETRAWCDRNVPGDWIIEKKQHKVHGQNLSTNVIQCVQPAQTYNCTVKPFTENMR